MSSYSATRLWSKWEVIKQVMTYFGDIQSFLRGNQDIGSSLRSKLLAFSSDSQTTGKLKIEIAAAIDWGRDEPFVKACYHLEGDEPLALECYEVVDQVLSSIAVENIPNVRAVSQVLSGGQPPAFKSCASTVCSLH